VSIKHAHISHTLLNCGLASVSKPRMGSCSRATTACSRVSGVFTVVIFPFHTNFGVFSLFSFLLLTFPSPSYEKKNITRICLPANRSTGRSAMASFLTLRNNNSPFHSSCFKVASNSARNFCLSIEEWSRGLFLGLES